MILLRKYLTSNLKLSTNALIQIEVQMKFLALFFTMTLLLTVSAHAVERDIQFNVREQIENYYSATGEWNLVRIKKIEKVIDSSIEFYLMSAKVQIQNQETAMVKSETCLLTFITDTNEFFAINCF